ncbi:U6 snRNA-associated Sm-like protein LSm6 [Rhodotorula toruloides]|uniref:U6 snRNA-associated Sm-like protein LSm6 n=1 Tax=Rhodotorula toruloides TaxID=5286 RepID=A0A511KK38_RHOTO|nr:U6 snRNA-associated Sm-like protein LSm6 [Rhodotorula toruloides]
MSDTNGVSPPPAQEHPEQPEQHEPALPGPSAFLKSVVGQEVVVRLNSGVDYRGVLNCLDGYMNIALEQTEEYVNGTKTNEYGDAFVRGNNVLYISKVN